MNRIPQDIHIPSYMTDWAERLKPVSFMELAQEIAQHGADCLGFGHDPMAEHGATWVLSRMHIIFEKMPKWKDDVRFETWHKALNGLLFLRDFEMLDAERNVLVSATSSWLIMDVAERRLCRPDRFTGLIPTEPQCPGDAIKEPAPKIVLPKDVEPELIREHSVHYSDVDFIGHANNTRYIEWAMDCLPEELLYSQPLKELVVNYNAEVHRGETVQFYRAELPSAETESSAQEGRRFIVEGRCNGRSSFITEFRF